MNAKKLIAMTLVLIFVSTCFAATVNAKWIEHTDFYTTYIDFDTVMRDSNGNAMLFKDGVQVAFVYNAGTFFIVYDEKGAHICKTFVIIAKSGNQTLYGRAFPCDASID